MNKRKAKKAFKKKYEINPQEAAKIIRKGIEGMLDAFKRMTKVISKYLEAVGEETEE